MIKYQIKYSYHTGSSFGSSDEEDILEYTWVTMETAKEALAKIKEHYLWYENRNHPWNDDIPRPKWLIKPKESWKDVIINIPVDFVGKDGKIHKDEVQFWPP